MRMAAVVVLRLAVFRARVALPVPCPYREMCIRDRFKRAEKLNIGVIAMKPLAGGAIEDGALALKFIRNNRSVTVAIPGMGNCKEVEENAKVYEIDSKLTEDEIKKIEEIKNSLGTEFCRRCGYCAPCPQGIDIPLSLIHI